MFSYYNTSESVGPSGMILLNAAASDIKAPTLGGFYVNPINMGTPSSDNTTGGLFYTLSSNEVSYSTSKPFIINHPTYPEKYLVHACLEGPEGGIYYRGKGTISNGYSTTIYLPEYVNNFGYDFTVLVTPIYDGKIHVCNSSMVENNEFQVYGDNCSFSWTVIGKREEITIEPNKKDVTVKSMGPYTWI